MSNIKLPLLAAIVICMVAACGDPIDGPDTPGNPDTPVTPVTPDTPQTVAVASVSLDLTSLELIEGESATITATVKPDNTTDKTVTWTSSDNSVATVDQSGRITAVAEGTAVITAKAGDKIATCTITVKKAGMPVDDPEGFNNENGEW